MDLILLHKCKIQLFLNCPVVCLRSWLSPDAPRPWVAAAEAGLDAALWESGRPLTPSSLLAGGPLLSHVCSSNGQILHGIF